MWTIPYLVSVLCMQVLSSTKGELEAPSDSYRKMVLEEDLQDWERRIKDYKEALEVTERALSKEREALQAFLPGKCYK